MSAIIIKNEKQIKAIRKSCQLSADTLDHLEPYIQPGITTEELNTIAEKFIRSYGAYPAPLGYQNYPKSICTSLNEVICHGIPGASVLNEGDIIKIDVSTILGGFYGDTCRTFAVGKISDEAQKLLSVTKDCLDIGITQVKPGAEFGMIGKAISEYAKKRGCSVVYQFVGHGTGIEFHEAPKVCHHDTEYDSTKMRPGMVFTIEPMLCLGGPDAVIDEVDGWTARTVDGKLAAQFEHTVLVTPVGVEVLTK